MGRECENLVVGGGHRYTVHSFVGFFQEEDRPTRRSVESYQVVKLRNGGVRFRLVVNDQYNSEMEHYIITYWQELLGCAVDVELVDEIPLMHNNKRMTIVDE